MLSESRCTRAVSADDDSEDSVDGSVVFSVIVLVDGSVVFSVVVLVDGSVVVSFDAHSWMRPSYKRMNFVCAGK